MASTAQVLDHVVGYEAYRNVPDEVAAIFKATLPVASLVKKATIRWPADDVIVFLRPSDGHLHVMPIGDDSKYHSRWEKFASFHLISGVRIDRERPDPSEYVMIKRAVKVGDVGNFIKNIYLKPQEWVLGKGKANPLSMMLAGSAITGLAGWGLGTAWDKTFGPVAHKLAPKYFSGRPRAGKWMGILGAMLGGGVPLWLGTQRHAQYGWPGWTMPYSKHDPSRMRPEAAQTIRDVQKKVNEIAPSVDPYRESKAIAPAKPVPSVKPASPPSPPSPPRPTSLPTGLTGLGAKEIINRLDRNGNGELDPGELPGGGKLYHGAGGDTGLVVEEGIGKDGRKWQGVLFPNGTAIKVWSKGAEAKTNSVLNGVNDPPAMKMYKRAAEYYSQMYMPIINVEEFTARIWDGVEKRAYYFDPATAAIQQQLQAQADARSQVYNLDPANDPYRNRLGPGGMALNEPGIHLNTFGSPRNYGTANPGTPPASAALAAGLVHGASAARGGSNWVSPMDVGRIAIGAGSGLLSGVVAGKILGALAGLTPEAENNIKRMGIWAGGLNAARNILT